jgi:antitoxin VapB
MPLSIKAPEADALARKLADTTGESITEAVIVAMRERLEREERKCQNKDLVLEEIRAVVDHCASLPLLDTRSEDEILGYDENGIPS